MNGRGRVLGTFSCALFAGSALFFAYLTWKVGFMPVRRGVNVVGPHSGFLKFWTDVFTFSTLLGAALGGIGTRRGGASRGVALAGFTLNVLAWVALTVLKLTGSS